MDGTRSEEFFIEESSKVYEFAFTPEKLVDTIDVTFVQATGTQMLTLDEIEVSAFEYVMPEPRPVDKSTLRSAIDAAARLVEEDYTAESWAALTEALAAAEAVKADAEAVQETVNAAAEALFDAMEALVKVVTKDALNDAIAAAKELASADYTEPTWKDLVAALAKAEEVAADEAATQEQVNAAAAALNTAIANLEETTPTYTVTVENGTLEDGTAEGVYTYNTKLTVTANKAPEGTVFAGWYVGETLLSTKEAYTFFVGSDLTVTAAYEEAAPEVVAAAYLQSVSVTKRNDGKSNLRYLAQIVLPEGAKLVDAGLVWTNKAATVTEDQLTLENAEAGVAGVKVTHIKAISTTGQFTVTINGVPTKVSVPGKVFATYTLGEETVTVYSEVGTGTAK